MATIIRYVDADAAPGGDGTTNALTGANCAYISLAVWEAARQADIDTANNIEQCICESSHANHTADVTACTIDGWTTSATDNIDILTSAGARHAGVYSASKYRIEVGGTILVILEDFVCVTGLQFKTTRSDGLRHSIQCQNNGTTIIRGNICKGVLSGTTTSDAIFVNQGGTGKAIIYNNIIYDYIVADQTYTAHGINAADLKAGSLIYNNTIVNCYIGIERAAGTCTMVNNLLASCILDAVGTIADTYCATTNDNTKGLTAAGTGNVFSITADFDGAEDFHIGVDSGAKDVGYDLGAAYQYDIDENDRDAGNGLWDIGADEYVAAGGATPINITDAGDSFGSLLADGMAGQHNFLASIGENLET